MRNCKALEALAYRHLLLVLDCCFAGAIRWSFTRSLDMPPEKIYREQYQMFVRTPAWQAITSTAYDQKALDRLAGNEVGDRVAKTLVGAGDAGLDMIFGDQHATVINVQSMLQVRNGNYPIDLLETQVLPCNHFQYFASKEGQAKLLEWLQTA